MTREEIIQGLYRGDSRAIKEAIEVLEQEPCKDAVSREELKKWLDMNFSFGGALRKLELFDRLDKELPSVTPKGVTVTDFADKCRECGKKKKGKWIIKASGFPPEPITVCSECGFNKDYSIRPRYFNKIKFCPNCGAEMESEHD